MGSWAVMAILNLTLVGLLGLFMRLKMLLPMAWLNQKYLMHAHSHFAFAGWVSHALMLLMLQAIFSLRKVDRLPTRYAYLLAANLFTAYGMLVCFSLQGYGLFAIIFSSLSILISFVFSALAWRDIGRSALVPVVKQWFKASLFFLLLSALGTFALVYLMVSKHLDPQKQLASVYFYLHFQYNGWFLFSCMGLFLHWLYVKRGLLICSTALFWLFFALVIPSYLLSVLWWKAFPVYLYFVLVLAVSVQFVLWCYFFGKIWRTMRQGFAFVRWNKSTRIFWVISLLGVLLKVSLQAASVVPALSQLVYAYRPIVIAYLHLVLLVIISLFILGLLFQHNLFAWNAWIHRCLMGFLLGVLLNELILTLQGIGALLGVYFPYCDIGLALAALLIVSSLLGSLKQLSSASKSLSEL